MDFTASELFLDLAVELWRGNDLHLCSGRPYDAGGRVTSVAKVVGSATYTTRYSYNLADDVTQVTYPSGRIVQQSYNQIGQLCSVSPNSGCTASSSYASSYSYDAAGHVLGFNYGNGVAASYTFSPARSQLTTLAYAKGTTSYFSTKYWYQKDPTSCVNGNSANNGQVQCITDNVSSSRSSVYGYDALGRMTVANTGTWNMSETYDRFGNRWTQSGNNVPNVSLAFGTMNNSTTNQPGGYQYDASGNLKVEPLAPPNNYTYDGENRMTTSSGNGGSGAYSYDGNGMRVTKAANGTTTVSIFSDSSVIAEYDNGAAPTAPSREYIYAGGKMLAMVSGGSTTYYHDDHLSTRVTTDANGNQLSQEGHFPFGELWYQTSGSNKWFFTSYNRDSEDGLDYALARYYNSRTGTFCSADPLAGSPGYPQSWNRYPYSRNDPINITDPSGQDWFFSFMKWFVTIASIAAEMPEFGIMFAGEQAAQGAGPVLVMPPPKSSGPSQGQPVQQHPNQQGKTPVYCNSNVMDAMKQAEEGARTRNSTEDHSSPKRKVEGGFATYKLQDGSVRVGNHPAGTPLDKQIEYGPDTGWDPSHGNPAATAIFHTHPYGGTPSSPDNVMSEGGGSGDTGFAINRQIDNYAISYEGLAVAHPNGPLNPPKDWDPWIVKGNGPADWLKQLKLKCGAH